jgi:hypothetical protein
LFELACLRSPSGRFEVVSADRIAALDLLRWAEETADRIERTLGLPMPFAQRKVRLVLRARPADGEAGTTASQRVEDGVLRQVLAVYGYEEADPDAAE